MNNNQDRHFSAYKGEVAKYFQLKKGQRFLDLTLGDGGHTEEALLLGCQVVSFDVDSESIARATNFLKNICTPILVADFQNYSNSLSNAQWVIVQTNFVNAAEAIKKLGLENFDAIMVDLGPSQYQVLSEDRGFSFSSNSELDMRIDKNLGVTAKDLVNALNEGELRRLFELGDEPFAQVIARIIVEQRKLSPIVTCKQLADIVSRVKHKAHSVIHPATQVFMTLRMAVNLERENISVLLQQIPSLLKNDGVFGIISFHSSEDRLVKQEIQALEEKNIVSVINKKPIEPTIEELKISQRTRSAKLRLAKKYN